MRLFCLPVLGLLAAVLLAVVPAAAAEGRVGVELNKLESEDNACQAYLVLENGTADTFDTLVLDLVMFDPDGIIARRLAVDIAPLGPGRLSVSVFAIPSLACEGIGRILVNGVIACSAGGVQREDCLDLIEASSRGGVALIN